MSFPKGGLLFVGLLLAGLIAGQDQRIADSLQVIYDQGNVLGKERLELIRQLAFHTIDSESRLKYAEELIDLAGANNDHLYLYRGFIQKGQTFRVTGDYSAALEAYIRGSEVADQLDSKSYKGGSFLSIADIYSTIGNADNARIYYDRAIVLLRQTGDTLTLASALLNAGDEAFKRGHLDLALQYFEESGQLFEALDYLIGKAYNIGNIGMVYAEQGKLDKAEKQINQAVAMLEEQEEYSPICEYLTYMSDIYLQRNNVQTALDYAQRSLQLARLYDLKQQISDTNLKLSELHHKNQNYNLALSHFQEHILYRDSIINLENIQEIADMRTDFEVAQKQIEVDLLEEKRRNQRLVLWATAGALFLIGILAIQLYRRYIFTRKTKKIIEEEKNRSDSLLRNILPDDVAEELKEKGKVAARKHKSVTVLFTDFKGFTRYAENLSPEEVVETIHFYFTKFDEIVEKYGLEKIKTIGDAYMCASGLEDESEDHAVRMVSAAMEIVTFVSNTKKDVSAQELNFDIRIGLHSGPVVAGVVGTRKFAYDIWGDTVNVASRMESMSEVGRVNISENTFELVKNYWKCSYRGELEVKNRGRLKMYFVESEVVAAKPMQVISVE